MMTFNLKTLDMVGKALPGGALVTSLDMPDFAQVMAVAAHSSAEPELTRSSQAKSSDTKANNVPTLPDGNGVGIANAGTVQGDMQAAEPAEQLPVEQPALGLNAAVDSSGDHAAKPVVAAPEPVRPVVQAMLQIAPIMQIIVPTIEPQAVAATQAPVTLASVRLRVSEAVASTQRPDVRSVETSTPLTPATVAPVLLELRQTLPEPRLVQTELVALSIAGNRTPTGASQSLPERALPTLVERMIAFTPMIVDAVRDLVQFGDGRDMRFNVRPEALGPVAVTIERTEAGQHLRLGVETPAALQVVKQAEPALNDQRAGTPFINVTVDMAPSDQRGRTPRAAAVVRPTSSAIPHEDQTGLARAGRYA
jgi:hypothetical protein